MTNPIDRNFAEELNSRLRKAREERERLQRQRDEVESLIRNLTKKQIELQAARAETLERINRLKSDQDLNPLLLHPREDGLPEHSSK